MQTLTSAPLRVLEFFSGLGGMRFALHDSGLPHSVLAAFDIDAKANSTYSRVFGDAPRTCSIEGLKVADLNRWAADTWLMSPPCQPFTRGGSRKDHLDARSRALLHLIDVLDQVAVPPRNILLENVRN